MPSGLVGGQEYLDRQCGRSRSGPVPAGERTQSATDLFLVFAGASIVATTLEFGATLAGEAVRL
jgi:hypothetical protein